MAGTPVGVGIGLRREFAASVPDHERRPDWLEIIPENFMKKAGPFTHALHRCRESFTIAAHGVSLNLGGPDPLDDEHLTLLKRLLDELGAPAFTEHLCWSMSHAHQSFDLLPLPFTEDAVRHVAGRIREVQDRLERPILVENVSTYALMPGGELSEGAFHRAVCEEADCGLLLDVNNVFVCATNHGRDPLEHLRDLPLERTGQMHLAGHLAQGDMLIDDHGHPVADPVWDLYREALRRTGPVPVLVEWDLNVPPLDEVLDQADKARAILLEIHPQLAGLLGAAAVSA